LDALPFSLPRHNSSAQLLAELPDELLCAPLHLAVPQRCCPASPLPLSCGGDPAPSPSESGCGTRLSTSATSRPVRKRMPHLAARDAEADCRPRTQAVLPPPSGSRFQTSWFLLLLFRR
jgi:hypothetical protein